MYKWEKYSEYDSKNPTFSSSLLDKINKSLKNNPKNDLEEELSFFRSTTEAKSRDDEKMSSLRRACLVEKWMEKKVSEKVTKKSNRKVKSSHTLLEEFDVQDSALFFSHTSTSSSSSEADYSAYYTHPSRHQHQQKQKSARVLCFAPPMPKSVRTRPIESKFLEQLEEKNGSVKDAELLNSRSKAAKIYSNLRNLKQPVSPGVRLTSFINSLFTKENTTKKTKTKTKTKNKNNNNIDNNNNAVTKSEKITTTSYSTCTTPSSYARSCLSNNKNKKLFQDDGSTKRTVRFCPVGVLLDEDSRPCGQKSVLDDGFDRMSTSKFARSLSKRYEELRILNGLQSERDSNKKKLEEVALDLLSGYCWDSRMGSKIVDDKVNNDGDYGGNYGGNYGVNYDHQKDNYDYGDDNYDDDDGLSCSSSDLFELDHLSRLVVLIPNFVSLVSAKNVIETIVSMKWWYIFAFRMIGV